jgi:hypothetical protein
MRKTALFFLMVLIMVLTACKGTTSTPAATPSPTPKPDCQLTSSIFPAPKDASAATYAPISSSDWVKGPEDATLTVIEYSDFT